MILYMHIHALYKVIRAGIRRTRRSIRLLPVLAAFGAILAGFSPVQLSFAQNPLSLDALKSPVPSPAALALPSRDEEIQKTVEQLEGRLKALRSMESMPSDASAEKVPVPGASPDEIRKRRHLLSELAVTLDAHIQALQELRTARKTNQGRTAEIRGWEGFSEKPPFPVSFVDGLREAVAIQKNDLQTMQLRLSIIKGELNRYLKALGEGRSQVRLQDELLEKSIGTGKEARQRWLRDMARLRNELNESAVASLETRRLVSEELIAARSEYLRFLEQKLRLAEEVSALSPSDVEQRLMLLDGQRKVIAQDLASALKQYEEILKIERQHREKMEQLQSPAKLGAEIAPVQQKELQRVQSQFQLHAARVEAARERIEVLKALMQLTDYSETMWEDRLWLTKERPITEIREKAEQLKTMLDNLKLWESVVQSRILSLAGLAQIHRARLDEGRESDRVALRVYEERLNLFQRAAEQLSAVVRLAGHYEDELGERLTKTSFESRLSDRFSIIAAFFKKLWMTELYVAEETVVVEGAKVVKPVSVTIAKVVQAFIILVVGVWIARKLMRPLRWLVVHKFRQDKSVAAQIGTVAFLLLFIVVFVFSLVSVNIPLAVFAFLGGALAIGVGFGAQNLINNFISGLILLFDRSISVGDIIEVDGQGGKVTSIGMRSSLVKRFDGVEMLVPNSQFLQQKVINWTHSERQMRYSLSVGVAYGSPTRKVSELLQQAVTEQEAVLKSPKPSVLFEDFGDSTLNFTVYFWLELESPRDNRELVSEMRHRITELFADAGIEIAFPQRDVHIDTAGPIPVRIISRDSQSGAETKDMQ